MSKAVTMKNEANDRYVGSGIGWSNDDGRIRSGLRASSCFLRLI